MLVVGGFPGILSPLGLDYWFNSTDAILMLDALVGDKVPIESNKPPILYSVAACGSRSAFDHTVTLP